MEMLFYDTIFKYRIKLLYVFDNILNNKNN
jgi:hypothetical protein